MWGKIIIPMYRLWLNGLYGLYGLYIQFSATSLSKWPPGGNIGFFGFQTLTLGWLWISTPNYSGTILMYMGRNSLIFSDVIFFFGFWTLSAAWFLDCKSSLLWSFNFKFHMHIDGGHRHEPIDFQWHRFQNGRLAAILDFLVFSDCNFSLALNMNSKLQWPNTCVYE